MFNETPIQFIVCRLTEEQLIELRESVVDLRKRYTALQGETERLSTQRAANESLIANLQITLAACEQEKVFF